MCARWALDHGQPRYDEDVWRCCEPSTEYAQEYEPRWAKLDKEMVEQKTHYYDEYKRFPEGHC